MAAVKFLSRIRVHRDTPSVSSTRVSKSMNLDAESREDSDKAEDISCACNTSYGLVAREKDRTAAENIMYEVIEDLPSKTRS